MFLSDKAKGIVRPIEEHETAELLLEYCQYPTLATNPRLTPIEQTSDDWMRRTRDAFDFLHSSPTWTGTSPSSWRRRVSDFKIWNSRRVPSILHGLIN